MYSQIIRDSSADLLHNKKLYIPHLISLGMYVALVIFAILQFAALAGFGIDFADPWNISQTVIILGIVMLAIDFVLAVFITAYTRAMSIGLLNDVSDKKNMGDMWDYGRKYFWRYAGVSFSLTLLQVVPLAIFSGLSVYMFFRSIPQGIITATVSIIVIYYWSMLLIFSLYFIEPVLINEKSSFAALKKAFAYAAKNHRNIFMVYGIVLLVNLIVQLALNIIMGIVLLPLTLAGPLAGIGSLINAIVKFAVGVVLMVFANLIIFRSFKTTVAFPKFAGFGSRALAMYIDSVILAPAFIAAAGWGALIVYNSGIREFTQDLIYPILSHIGVALLVLIALDFLYFTIPVALFGGTPGKLLLGLRIADNKGNKISIFRAIARYFCYIVSIVPAFMGFIWIIIDKDNQGWHDKICRTQVIYV